MIMTIRERILLSFLGLILITGLSIGLHDALNTAGLKRDEYRAFLNSAADSKIAQVDGWTSGLSKNLQYLQTVLGEDIAGMLDHTLDALNGPASGQRRKVLAGFERHIRITGQFEELFVLDADGMTVLSTQPHSVGVFQGLQDFFLQGLEKSALTIPKQVHSSVSAERLDKIVAAQPVRSPSGETIGVLCGYANLGVLDAIMAQWPGPGETIHAYLVNENRVLITRARFSGLDPGQSMIMTTGVEEALASHGDGYAAYADAGGVPVFGAYRWIPGINSVLLAEISTEEVYSQARAQGMLTLALTLSVLVVVAVLALFMSRQLSTPLTALTEHANAITKGGFASLESAPFRSRKDEIGLLARAFTDMTQALANAFQEQQREIATRKEAELSLLESKEELGRLYREQRDVLEKLTHSERKYRTLIESTNQGYVLVDPDRTVREVNESLCGLLGYSREELTGTLWDTYIAPEEMERYLRIAATIPFTRHRSFDITMASKTGSRIPVSISATTLFTDTGGFSGSFGLITDQAERLRMEKLLIQSEKMTTVATLAAGITHEINNPLAGIIMSAQNIARRLSPEMPANVNAAQEVGCSIEQLIQYLHRRGILEMLVAIREAGERATRIVRGMLAFSRDTGGARTSCDLIALTEHCLHLVQAEFDVTQGYDFNRIKILRQYGEIPGVFCAPTEIEQVVINILKNAAQAMFSNPSQTQAPAITLTAEAHGDMAYLTIADNGPGMEESVRKRVFEPFFTTKAAGKGSGLGLAVSNYIISRHDGQLSVESEPGRGTRFTIGLPVVLANGGQKDAA